jgi:hypothetical protein
VVRLVCGGLTDGMEFDDAIRIAGPRRRGRKPPRVYPSVVPFDGVMLPLTCAIVGPVAFFVYGPERLPQARDASGWFVDGDGER